jgi:23S rRNA (pseudouridine1915-N3)-methyltransferase
VRIRLVVVGREAPFLRAALAEYRGRLDHYARTEVQSVAAAVWPAKPTEGEAARLLAEEAQRVRPAWQGEERALLARDGVPLSSEAVAAWLGRLEGGGTRSLGLLVGGPGGVEPALRAEADSAWSLGPQTLPHTLCAVVVLEQLYRAYRILRGEPYHH